MDYKIDERKKYAKSHEWVSVEGDVATIGISDYAQRELGDIANLEFPEKGTTVKKGDVLCAIESVKAVEDMYSPVSGEVMETNNSLESALEKINEDPYGSWIVKIKMSDTSEIDSLMDSKAYGEYLKKSQSK